MFGVILMSIRDELEPFTSNGYEAGRFVEELLDAIVVALRRDPRFAGIPLHVFE